MVARRALAATALVMALAAHATPAWADDRAAAAEAYDRGQRAFDAGDFRQAAEHFQTADRLAPSAPALEGAITAATRADDAGLALELADRADGRRGDPRLDGAAREARSRFAARAGKLIAGCGARPCSLRVASAPWPPGTARWIAAGDHVVVIDRGAGEERFAIVVRPGETTTWTAPDVAPSPPPPVAPPAAAPATPPPALPPPAVPPPAPQPAVDQRADAGGGPSPAWFFVGLGATVVLGGATIGTGVATLAQHDEFEAGPSEEARSNGLLLQNTTNALIAGTAVAGIVTVVLAAVVDWSGDPAPSPSGDRRAILRF
jgi:hypothetical protein